MMARHPVSSRRMRLHRLGLAGGCRLGLILLACAATLAGCAFTSPVANVPVQENAAKQYRYAVDYRESKNIRLITDPHKLNAARMVVRQTFEKVPEFFPDDRTFTPLAKLEALEMDAGLDIGMDKRRIELSKGEVHRAIKGFQDLAEDYPEHEFLQAKTLYDQALCHKHLGEFAKAQAKFKKVRDKYLKNANKDIAGIAERANYYYNQTYVNE